LSLFFHSLYIYVLQFPALGATLKMTDNGIGTPVSRSSSTTTTIISFIVLALYNVIELHFIIFGTFKNRHTLYFYSFLVSTWGIAIYSIGFLIKDLQLSSRPAFFVTLIIVGWCSMVTGQSVVLYSRLHLIIRKPGLLRLVLGMIIFNAIICHVPIAVLVYGANSASATPFLVPYSIYEKVQVSIFFIQELIISSLYIVHTMRILRAEGSIRGKASRQVMTHLIHVNAIIVLLDITILALEYSGLYDIQTAYKALVYSVKLKLEFSILNRLVSLTRKGVTGYVNSNSRLEDQQPTRAGQNSFDAARKGSINKVNERSGTDSHGEFVPGGDKSGRVEKAKGNEAEIAGNYI